MCGWNSYDGGGNGNGIDMGGAGDSPTPVLLPAGGQMLRAALRALRLRR